MLKINIIKVLIITASFEKKCLNTSINTTFTLEKKKKTKNKNCLIGCINLAFLSCGKKFLKRLLVSTQFVVMLPEEFSGLIYRELELYGGVRMVQVGKLRQQKVLLLAHDRDIELIKLFTIKLYFPSIFRNPCDPQPFVVLVCCSRCCTPVNFNPGTLTFFNCSSSLAMHGTPLWYTYIRAKVYSYLRKFAVARAQTPNFLPIRSCENIYTNTVQIDTYR